MIDWCHSDQSDGVMQSCLAKEHGQFCWLAIPVTFLVFVEKKGQNALLVYETIL